MEPERGLLVALSGPSGVGKGRLRTDLLRAIPSLTFCPSVTSRPKRPGEIDGVHYTFVSEAEFRRRIEQGEFLEWADVYGQLKGTPRQRIDEVISQGRDALLEKDVKGALAIREQRPEAVLIFIAPPSLDELFRRLAGRGTETPEQLARRREAARRELRLASRYDYVVVNDRIEDAIDQLRSIILAERRRVSRLGTAWVDEMLKEV